MRTVNGCTSLGPTVDGDSKVIGIDDVPDEYFNDFALTNIYVYVYFVKCVRNPKAGRSLYINKLIHLRKAFSLFVVPLHLNQ